MRIVYRFLGYTAAAVLLFLLGILIYLNTSYPKVGKPKTITVRNDSIMVERGKYLANHVTGCIDCHSSRDWSVFGAPLINGTEGKGCEVFDETLGVPGRLVSKNLTPFALADWTNGEIYRAFACGVNRNGDPLFPLMPYPAFGTMDFDDAMSIIAYIRTLKPIESKPEESKLNFPMNLIVRTMPQEAHPVMRPSPDNKVAYGKYMVTICGCGDCHSPSIQGEKIPGKDFSGGVEFKLTGYGTDRTANITPDNETGIGKWTESDFIKRFKEYEKPEMRNIKIKKHEFQTIMPWLFYCGMTEKDLGAIYSYLRTVSPVKNKVKTFTPDI